MRTPFCIANLNARAFRKSPAHVSELQRFFPDPRNLRLTRTLDEARQALDECAAARPGTVVVCGGDGTLNFALDHLARALGDANLPRVVIVPAGTMNVVSRGFTRRGPLSRLDFRAAFAPGYLDRPGRALGTLRCNGRLGFIFGAGGFSNFVARYRESPDPTPGRGVALLARTVLSTLVGGAFARATFGEFAALVEADGVRERGSFVSLSVSSISHIGFGCHAYPDADPLRGTLGTLWMRERVAALPLFGPWFLAGRRLPSRACVQAPVRTVAIRLDAPLAPMMDGEIFPAEKTFAIERGPVWEVLV